MKIVNTRNGPVDVMIDRSTKFGNPFFIGKDGNRKEVIQKYRIWLWQQIKNKNITIKALQELNGKRCGCWCKPLACLLMQHLENPKLKGGTKVQLPDGFKTVIVSTYYGNDGIIYHLCPKIRKKVGKELFLDPISFKETDLKTRES